MARGYNASADVIRSTVDGKDLNDLWSEFSETLNILNERRSAVASLFTFRTTLKADEVAQTSQDADFEEASEYGVPKALRVAPSTVRMGFPLKWFDLAARYTWSFLRDASASQVEAVHQSALEADNKLTFRKIMTALFNNVSTAVNEDGTPIRALWNGDDTPPPYAGLTFASTHSHYLTSGATVLDGGDLELLISTITEHGYGLADNGDRVIIAMNPAQAVAARGFRAGVANASFDFIPSVDAPAYLTDLTLVGDRPPGQFQGLKVFGSYGSAWLVENHLIPVGYVVSVGTSGPDSPRNPLAFREHIKTGYQGLKQMPGNRSDYPLVDSYYARGFGVGVRHRGAAAVMQVTASATYTPPVFA